jgi:riboflavin synthase
MFTGLIQTVGRVQRVIHGAGADRLTITSDLPVASMTDGESIAVDGVCLTVACRSGKGFEADAVAETLKRTTLGRLRVGDPVHLERSLTLRDFVGGHLVQGHVDAVAKIVAWKRRGADVRLTVALPAGLRRFVAEKGAIAVHGVSLTIAERLARSFTVALIPETLARTKLGRLRPGEGVNLEVDVIARYLESLMSEKKR